MQISAVVSVNADGTVNVVTGAVDIGGSRATSAMAAAEVLGLRAEQVRPLVADTNSIGYTGSTAGSHVTYDSTLAIATAAEQVKQELARRVALLWECRPEDIDYEAGEYISRSDPTLRMTFAQVASRMIMTGGPVSASAINQNNAVGDAFGGVIVDVEVDPETGKVGIVRCTAFTDCGTAIHPSYVEGQVQGGTAQGLGWALHEEYFYDEAGRLANASLLDYRMPTSLDVPMIDTVLVEVPNPRHPFGVRGVGEMPIVTPPAAVANAIARTGLGLRMTELPLKPAAILRALGIE
jgi:CO/xanthine dehydrogenase Mo-binding subunit